ncbi:uncharacterized protein LOC142360706 isoform X2 [Opisthocomus hoazin]|uniref:uncharacterized protein LOC142360706 isoform X2 n=1 Tax=Opisthocomus hoazin TaxID=30419 RepID=UPI003F537F2C
MVGLKPPEVPPTAAVKFFSAGTAGCIADLVTFPLDTAKVRLQIQGEVRIPRGAGTVQYRGVLGTLSTMVRTEGPRSLYSGLAAGLQRQMSFASIRIGLYDSVKQLYTPKGAESAGLGARVLAGCTTGAVAVTCAQPTDVVKVRFQANGALPAGARRYSGTVDAYCTIAREEGVRGLWRGTLPNIARNAIINCGELVTYDLVKDALLRAQLMTGEDGAGEGTHSRAPSPSPRRSALPCRQRPLPFRGRLRRRLLRHAGGVAGGRGEDAVHERRPRAVPQRAQLPPRPADAGRPRRLLQGVRPLLPAARLLEHRDVRLLRAAAARHGAGTVLTRPGPSRQRWRDARVNYINWRSGGRAAMANAPSPTETPERERRDGRRNDEKVSGEKFKVEKKEKKNTGFFFSSWEEQRFPAAAGPSRGMRPFLQFLPINRPYGVRAQQGSLLCFRGGFYFDLLIEKGKSESKRGARSLPRVWRRGFPSRMKYGHNRCPGGGRCPLRALSSVSPPAHATKSRFSPVLILKRLRGGGG